MKNIKVTDKQLEMIINSLYQVKSTINQSTRANKYWRLIEKLEK